MALGLAIIFGQMGVINMAHGEFMILGAYMTYLFSHSVQDFAAGPASRSTSSSRSSWRSSPPARSGWLVEWLLIRHLYKRPLDTLLATWGLSLIMQQAFRSIFGAARGRRRAADLDDGLVSVTDTIEIPINGLFVMGADAADHRVVVVLLIFRSRWGLQVRAVVSNRAMAARSASTPSKSTA